MTEAEWLACEGTRAMLRSVRGPVSYRKLRLLIGGSCRVRWYELGGDDVQKIVTSVEALADDDIDGVEFLTALRELESHGWFGSSLRILASGICWRRPSSVQDKAAERLRSRSPEAWEAGEWAEVSTLRFLEELALLAGFEYTTLEGQEAEGSDEYRAGVQREATSQTPLLRDIFGNPFRPVTFTSEWRTSTAVALGQHIYESRDFSAMPILADALQDAGCDNADILTHCRDEKATHVRGCWVVDLVLGKE